MDHVFEAIPEDGEIPSSGLHEQFRHSPSIMEPGSTTIGSAATPEFRPRRPILHVQTGNPAANHTPGLIQIRRNVLRRSPGSQTPSAHKGPFVPSSPLATQANDIKQTPSAPRGPSLHRSSPLAAQSVVSKIQSPGPRILSDPRGAHVRPVSHTNSMTWRRHVKTAQEKEQIAKDKERNRWLNVHANLKKWELDLRAKAIVPQDFDEWVAHRRGRLQDEQKEKKRKIDNRKAAAQAGYSGFLPGYRPPKIGPAFGGKSFAHACAKNFSAVLSWPTIWCTWYRPSEERPEPPWPCADEMREEGDERKTSGFGRFPAIPRVPGNPTVVWKQKPNIAPYFFDRLWPVPTAESVAEAAASIEPAEYRNMEAMLCQDLLDAIDCKGPHDC